MPAGIGYKPKKGYRKYNKKAMRIARRKRTSALYKKVISIVGRPEVKYTHFTFNQKTGTAISYFLNIYNISNATINLDRRSVCRAFVFPIGGDTGITRDGNRISMKKVYCKYQIDIPANLNVYFDVSVRVVVFSGLQNPDFTTAGITGLFRWYIDQPALLNAIDQRDFTVWYDKTHLIKAASYLPNATGANVAVTRNTKVINCNFKMRGKHRNVVFDNDDNVLPKDQEKQQLYICVFAYSEGIPDGSLIGYLKGNGTLYYLDN